MKNIIRNYSITIGIMFVVFNIIAFVAPGWANTPKYTPAFCIGYVATIIAFVAHYILTVISFKDSKGDQKKLFYNIPIIYLSYGALIVSIIVGSLCMLNSLMPAWIAIIATVIVIVFYALVISRTKIAIDIIQETDKKVEEKTSLIRELSAQAKALASTATSPAAREETNKVFEAIRYSDPVSNESTSSVDSSIKLKFEEFKAAVKANEDVTIPVLSKEVISLINERNELCKGEKR